jgi:vacuolar-type H+-ATPase subunit D/Vma8
MTRDRKIKILKEKRDLLWKYFCQIPKKGSFSGLAIGQKLENVQNELDILEGENKSERYYPKIRIDIG